MIRVAFTYNTPIVWENMLERREDVPVSEFKDMLEDIVVNAIAVTHNCGAWRVKPEIVKDVEGHIIFQIDRFIMTKAIHMALLYGMVTIGSDVKVYTEALFQNPAYKTESERERVEALLEV